jgi:large subunit ribosomal protein L18
MAHITKTERRTHRTRNKIRKVNVNQSRGRETRPRLSVYRSARQIYAQIIDDVKGVTIAAASTLDTELKDKLKKTADKNAAAEVGKMVAARAKKAGISKVVFDRGQYMYHGRVKALADGAREGGLQF